MSTWFRFGQKPKLFLLQKLVRNPWLKEYRPICGFDNSGSSLLGKDENHFCSFTVSLKGLINDRAWEMHEWEVAWCFMRGPRRPLEPADACGGRWPPRRMTTTRYALDVRWGRPDVCTHRWRLLVGGGSARWTKREELALTQSKGSAWVATERNLGRSTGA